MPETFSDETVWYTASAGAAKNLLRWGIRIITADVGLRCAKMSLLGRVLIRSGIVEVGFLAGLM